MTRNDLTCDECGAEFDSREKLDRHNEEKHGRSARSGSSESRTGEDLGSNSEFQESRRRETLD